MTQDTEDVVARVVHALRKKAAEIDHRPDVHCADVMWFAEEYARAALEASDRQSLSDRIDGLESVVEKCREKFDFYEQLHRLKCTAEGDEKADRNREMADLCSAALHQEGIDATE